MSADYLVIGHFAYVDDTISAIKKMKDQGLVDYELFSPFPNHDLEDEVYYKKPRSPVRCVTLLGGIIGCLSAFLMTCWMSVDWPLRVSAKPLISIPAFVVIGFECTILIGGISNLLAMFHFSKIPNLSQFPGYRPNFSNGTFGLIVRVAKERTEAIKQELSSCGASQVEIQYVR